LSVSILSHEKCKFCRTTYTQVNDWECQIHGTRPKTVYIRIYSRSHIPLPGHALTISRLPSTGNLLQIVEASEMKAKIEKEITDGIFNYLYYMPANANMFLFENVVSAYLEDMKKRSELDPNDDRYRTKARYGEVEKYHRLYLTYFNGIEIKDIHSRRVSVFLDEMENQKGKSASATLKRKAREVLAATVRWAFRKGYFNTTPDTDRWPIIKSAPTRIVTLTPDQQQEILNKLRGEHPIIQWMIATGERGNAARAKKICDIDLLRGCYFHGGSFDYYPGVNEETYKPYPKNRNRASDANPLTKELRQIVESAVGGRNNLAAEDWLFINPRSGKPYTHNVVRNLWYRARKKAGLSAGINMGTRHSWATQRIAEGFQPHEVAMFQGNSGKIVERRYVDTNPDVKRQVMEFRQASSKSVKNAKK